MATQTAVVPFAQPGAPTDIQNEIKNVMDARQRLEALIANLETQRKDAGNAFLKAFTTDLAAVKGDPDKAFVDAQFAKFNASRSADEEIAKRIAALRAIADGLAKRVEEFKVTYRDQVIALLTAQIQALEEQLKQQESQEDILNQRLAVLKSELDQLSSEAASAKSAASARKR
jgi:chromosome segregation ATPase